MPIKVVLAISFALLAVAFGIYRDAEALKEDVTEHTESKSMRPPVPSTKNESDDAVKLDDALQAMKRGDLPLADKLLQEVIANAPAEYPLIEETEKGISIKLWDSEAFAHYVTWNRKQGEADQEIIQLQNVYPQAYFYLGFLRVKQGRHQEALKILNEGQKLEPDNPRFTCEKAIALISLNRKKEALSLYESISEIGPFVSAGDVARALRGRGFVLVEMGELDRAEQLLKKSLTLDPHSKVALRELEYINNLRSGGKRWQKKIGEVKGSNYRKCEVCGVESDEGVMVAVRDRPVKICDRCHEEMLKNMNGEEHGSPAHGHQSVEQLIGSIKEAAKNKDTEKYFQCVCLRRVSVEQQMLVRESPDILQDTLLDVTISPFKENRLDEIEKFEFNAHFEGLLEFTYQDSGKSLAPFGKYKDRYYLLSIVPAAQK